MNRSITLIQLEGGHFVTYSCQPSNVTTIEQREKKGTITLETLEKVAQAMGCKLIYSLVSLEPFNKTLEKRARGPTMM